MMIELWTRMGEMGDNDGNDVDEISGYEKSWVRLDWLGWEDHVWMILRAWSGLVFAVSGMVNWLTHKILSSPSFSWWFPPSPLFSLFLVLNSTITLENEVKSSLSISPCHDQELTLSTSYTQVLHTPSTASAEYCIHRVLHHPKIDFLSLPGTPSSLGRACCTQFNKFSQLGINQRIESQLPSRLIPELQPPSTSPISLERGLQVHLQTRSITASRCISHLAPSWPPSASPNSHDHSLQVYLQPCSITASKFPWSPPPSESPNSLDHSPQVYLQPRLIMASKFAPSPPPNAHSRCLGVHI